ncbi:MAG: hypothetical protein IPK76_08430 [Lewinellaceae bacterium]|nr:hypothetical protein [Lewinellaceae bacterium]
MLRNYFNRDNGWNVVMNFTNKGAHIGGGYGNDFWYEVHNNVLFYSVADLYPDERDFSRIQRSIAEQFYRSDSVMGNSYGLFIFRFQKHEGRAKPHSHARGRGRRLCFHPVCCLGEIRR